MKNIENNKKYVNGGTFQNLRVPFGLIINNNHYPLQQELLHVNSIKTMPISTPFFDNLLGKVTK
jgi:hypothetical protein